MNTSNRLDAFMRAFFALICCASITGTSLHAASEDIQLGWATAPVDPFGPGDFIEAIGEQARGVARDLDGNIILAGFHDPSGPAPLRFAALQLIPGAPGEVALGWATALSGPFGPSVNDRANGVAIDLDGNSILAGRHEPFVPLGQFAALQLIPNMSGGVDLGWATAPFEPFGPSTGDSANAVAVSASGSVILAGQSDAPNRFAALQLIPNMSGGVDLGWATALIDPLGPSDTDIANAIAIDASGNIILVGEHNPIGLALSRFAALQLIPSGSGVTLGWVTAIFDPFGSSEGDAANSVAIDSDGNLILAGFHDPSGPESIQFAALQLIPNMSGSVDLGWATAISDPFGPSQLDIANDIVINEDGNIIIGGFHGPILGPNRFAVLQLIPNMSGSVDLGWVTAPIAPFGPSSGDSSLGLTLDAQGNPILAGEHRPVSAISSFAALQLLEIMPPPLPPLVEQLSLPFVLLAAA